MVSPHWQFTAAFLGWSVLVHHVSRLEIVRSVVMHNFFGLQLLDAVRHVYACLSTLAVRMHHDQSLTRSQGRLTNPR
jgi:hypothetical protein